MSGPWFRMVLHNDTDHAVARQGPSKPAESPKPCAVPPTHFHPFRDQRECDLITQAVEYLNHSGFYWGPLEVDEAHTRLAKLPLGTFLIRDSMQANVFFTLSYRAPEGPTSVRLLLKDGGFSLAGSKHTLAFLACLDTILHPQKRVWVCHIGRSAAEPARTGEKSCGAELRERWYSTSACEQET